MSARIVIALIAVALLCGCAHPTRIAGAPGSAWGLGYTTGEGAKLSYGVPETDNLSFMATCLPRSGRVTVWVPGPDEAKTAMLELRSGPLASAIRAMQDSEQPVLAGTFSATDDALQRFRVTGDLAYSVNGKVTRLPGAGEHARKFMASCGKGGRS